MIKLKKLITEGQPNVKAADDYVGANKSKFTKAKKVIDLLFNDYEKWLDKNGYDSGNNDDIAGFAAIIENLYPY